MTQTISTPTQTVKRKGAAQQSSTIFLLLSLGLSAALYSFYIRPTTDETNTLRGQIEQTDQRIADAQAVRNKLPELQQQNSELKNQLNQFQRSIPNEEQIDNLIQTMGGLADQNNVQISNLSRNPLIQKDTGIKQVGITLNARGDFPNLYGFIQDLYKQQRYINVDHIELRASHGSLDAQMQVNAFVNSATPGNAMGADTQNNGNSTNPSNTQSDDGKVTTSSTQASTLLNQKNTVEQAVEKQP